MTQGRMKVTTTVSEFSACDVTVDPDADACKCPCGSSLLTLDLSFTGGEQCLNTPPPTTPAPAPSDEYELAPDEINGLWGWWDGGDTDGQNGDDLPGRGGFPDRCFVWDPATQSCSDPTKTTQATCENIRPVHDLTSWVDKSGNGHHLECPDAIDESYRIHGRWTGTNSWPWTTYSPQSCSNADYRCCPNSKDAEGADKCTFLPACPFVWDRRWTNVALHRPAIAAQSYAPTANYGALKATDGSAMWYNDASMNFRVNTGAWIRIDLGTEKRISFIRYYPAQRDSKYMTARVGNNEPNAVTGANTNPICGEPMKQFQHNRPDIWVCTSGDDDFIRGRWVMVQATSSNFYGCEIEAFEDASHAESPPLADGAKRPVVRFEGYQMMRLTAAAGNAPTGAISVISVARYTGKRRGRLITSLNENWIHGFYSSRQNLMHGSGGVGWITDTGWGYSLTEDGSMTGPLILHEYMGNNTVPWEMNNWYRDYRDNFERPPNQWFYTNGIENTEKYTQKWRWNNLKEISKPGRIQLGARDTGFSESSHGEVAELIVFDRNISTYERKGLERYLAKKWDIVTMRKETDYPEYVEAEAKRNKTCSELNWPDMSSASIGEDNRDCHTKARGDQYCTVECPCGDEDGWSSDSRKCKRGVSRIPELSRNVKYGFESNSNNWMCDALPGMREKLRETCARGDGCDPSIHGFLDKDEDDDEGPCTTNGCPSPATHGMVKYSDAEKYCDVQGARLCSFPELWRGEAESSGCIKYEKIWTLNKCSASGDPGRWATTQNAKKINNVNERAGNHTKCLAEDSEGIEGDVAFPVCCSSKIPNAKADPEKQGVGWSSDGCPGQTCPDSCLKPAGSWELAERLGMCKTKGECMAKGYMKQDAKDECLNRGFSKEGRALNWMVASHMFPNNCACDCRRDTGVEGRGVRRSTNYRPRDCERWCGHGKWRAGYRGFAALNFDGINVDGQGGYETVLEATIDSISITAEAGIAVTQANGNGASRPNAVGTLKTAINGDTTTISIVVDNRPTSEIGAFDGTSGLVLGAFTTSAPSAIKKIAGPYDQDTHHATYFTHNNVPHTPTTDDFYKGQNGDIAGGVPTTEWKKNEDPSVTCTGKPTAYTTGWNTRSQPREQTQCLWTSVVSDNKEIDWTESMQTGTGPWPRASDGDTSSNTMSANRRKCNYGWHSYSRSFKDPNDLHNGCACHVSGLEYYFQNQWDRKVRLDTVPVLGESVATEDGVTNHYTVAPGEPRWVNYDDNGRLTSRCGGPQSGKTVNLYCHYYYHDFPFKQRFFRHHAAVAATYIYSDRAKEVTIRFKAARTGILYLNGVYVDQSDQYRDAEYHLNTLKTTQVNLQKGQNWFMYEVNGRDGHLAFILLFDDTEGLTSTTVALDESKVVEQCVPTPFGSVDDKQGRSNPVDRSKCTLCDGDFFCSRNQTLTPLEFIDPLRSDTNDPVAQREITKLMFKVKGDMGLDAVTNIDENNRAGIMVNNYTLGHLQGVGSAGTWQCNSCFETERFGLEMNQDLEKAYQYYDRNSAAGGDNGRNRLIMNLPPKHAWCISNVQILMCAKPGPPKVNDVRGYAGSDPAALNQRGGERIEIIGQNLGPNTTFQEMRYGPEAKPAYKVTNCTMFPPRFERMLCMVSRGIGGPYHLRVLTDTLSVSSPPLVFLKYADPVVTSVTHENGALLLNSDGNNLVSLSGDGLLPAFTDVSTITMNVVSSADPGNKRGLRGSYAEIDAVSGAVKILVPIGQIGSSQSLNTIHPRLSVQYFVKNNNPKISWNAPSENCKQAPSNDACREGAVNDFSVSNFIDDVKLKFSPPDIKATYLTFDQENATAIRTNMRVQVVGVGFCANSECCKLESCDPEDLTDCILLEEMTPEGGLCGEENDDNACSPMIDGLASRQFQYPADKTMWLQRSVRLLTIFNSTEHGFERLESAARIIADKNPEFTTHADIETPSSAGGAMNVTCKYVTAATVLAYLQTPIQRGESNSQLPKTVIKVVGFFPSSGDDEFVITIDVPPGMGSNNRIWLENSGQPSRPRILNYPVPEIDKIYLESDPTIVEGNQCSGGAGCNRPGFIVTSVGQVAIVEGNNFGPSCTELEVPKSCSPLSSGEYRCVTEPVKDNSHQFCNAKNCLYSESADLCLDAPSEFTRPGSVKVFPGGILPKATVKLVDSITNTSKEVQVLHQSQSEIKIKLPPGENVVFGELIKMLQLKVVIGDQEPISSPFVRYFEPTILSVAPVSDSSGFRTDGTSQMKISGRNFGSPSATIRVNVGASPPRECTVDGIDPASRTDNMIICNLPPGAGKNVPVNIYVSQVGVADAIFPQRPTLDKEFSDFKYDAPVIQSIDPSVDLPTSGYYYERVTSSNSNSAIKLSVADGDMLVSKAEKTYLDKEYASIYIHMSKDYIAGLLRDNIESWATRAAVTVVGKNFGPPGSEKEIHLSRCTKTTSDSSACPEERKVTSKICDSECESLTILNNVDFVADNHTHIIFELSGGTGVVKLDVLVAGQKQESVSEILKYAPPKIHEIKFSDDNGDFSAPTSGCAEYGPLSADADVRPCNRKAKLLLYGTNFGSEQPKIFFTFLDSQKEDNEPIIQAPIKFDHYEIVLLLPAGAGEVSVLVESSGLKSNSVTYQYSPPEVSGLLSGVAIETARLSDMFDARGLPENKIFIFGHNFGAEPSAVNISISGIDCLKPSWHEASRFSAPPGMPYLSCQPSLQVVGSHSLLLKVAGAERLITQMQSGKTIDARCPPEFYGKIGELCVACWTYKSSGNILPAATCTGDWVIKGNASSVQNFTVPKMLSDGNETMWGRSVALAPKGSDSNTGTADPIAMPGFHIFPPPECLTGGCLPDPALGSDIDLPESCKPVKAATDDLVIIPDICEEANKPGPFCHPHRFDGICIESDPGFIECTHSTSGDQVNDFEYRSESTVSKATVSTPRKVCPHILTCEPKEACLGGTECLVGYESYYEPFNNIEESIDANTGERVLKTVNDLVCSPRHYTLPDGSCYAPRCGQCNPKTHFRLEGECAACPEYPWLMPLILASVAVFAALGMYILTKKNVNLAVMSIGIDYFQVLGLFTRSRVKWPPEIKWLFRQFQWAMFDIDLTAPECAFRQFMTYENKFYIKLLLPLLGVTVIGLVLGFNYGLGPILCPKPGPDSDSDDESERGHKKGSSVKVMPQLPKAESKEEVTELKEGKHFSLVLFSRTFLSCFSLAFFSRAFVSPRRHQARCTCGILTVYPRLLLFLPSFVFLICSFPSFSLDSFATAQQTLQLWPLKMVRTRKRRKKN